MLPTCLQGKAHLWVWFQKSSSSRQPCLLMRLDWSMSNMLKEERKLSEAKSMLWLLLLRSVAKRVGWRKRKEGRKGHSALWSAEAKETETHIWPVCVSSRVSKNTEIFSHFERCSPCEEIERNTVRVWVSEKKMWHFSLLKLHTRKINWWSSHKVFECYNHEELEYSKKDFATGFVVRLYLLIEIYLLYIQFIMDSSLA